MVKEKGVLHYLEAARICNADQKKFNFLLVGQLDTKAGVTLSEIEAYSQEVKYLGRREDVKELLSISDIFVLPTYYGEGVPRVLLEASAMSLALVSTDMPGCNDVVLDDITGKLCAIKDPQDLAEKLLYLKKHPRLQEKMKQEAKKHVQNFTLEKVAQQTLEIYERL